MQWPDIKSDGVMIDGIMLRSEMSPVGPVRGAAEPVLWAAKSEVFTPVVFAGGGGGVVAAAAPLAVVEAVTARVSVLPVVGSDLPTGLSAVVGVTKQLEVDLGNTLDKVGHGAGQSCVRMVPADLREVRDIMFSVQFFLSDEKGEMDMPSRINGGRASLQQEVDFDSVYRCPQKMRHVTGTHRLEKLSPPKRATVRVDTVESKRLEPVQKCPVTLESHDGRSNSGDRRMSRYDDADWFKENPNRVVGREVFRTGTTCADYCPYIKGISVSNRPAVEAIVFISPDRLVRYTRDKDTTWIRLTYFWFHNCQVWWIVMSSSNMVPEADRPRAVDTDSTQPPETFLGHVLEAHMSV